MLTLALTAALDRAEQQLPVVRVEAMAQPHPANRLSELETRGQQHQPPATEVFLPDTVAVLGLW